MLFNNIEIPFNVTKDYIEHHNIDNQYKLNISQTQDYIFYNNKRFPIIHTNMNYNINEDQFKFIGDPNDNDICYSIGKKDNILYLHYLKLPI